MVKPTAGLLLAVAAGSAAGQGPNPSLGSAPYERLDATDATYALNPTVSYVRHAGNYCPKKNLAAATHWHEDVRKNTCHRKCGGPTACTGADCHCEGYIAEYDNSEKSDALCLTEAKCQALCTKLDDCYGFEIATDANEPRCFLASNRCMYEVQSSTLTASADWDFLVKSTSVSATCPLGIGAEVAGTDIEAAATLYQKVDDETYVAYNAESTAPHVRVKWHNTGCGWVVEQDVRGDAPPTPPAPACADNVEAGNALFGFDGDDAQPTVCATAQAWSGSGYCSHPVFKRACAATCADVEPCTADSNAAAVQYAKVMGLLPSDATEAGNPNTCAVLQCDADAVVPAICPTTCGSRRLGAVQRSAAEKLAHASRMALGFRRQLSAAAAAHREARRLGVQCRDNSGTDGCPQNYAEVRWEELYYTWKPTTDAGECPPGDVSGVADATRLNSAPLYNVHKFNRPAGPALDHTCPEIGRYSTTEGKFCPHNNLMTQASVQAERCEAKCQGTADKAGATGMTGFCSGNDATFRTESNALCLGRKECEALCDSLADCSSVDMHTQLPRCYLNGLHCEDATIVENGTYWQLLRKETGRTAWRTSEFDMTCNATIASIISTTPSVDRVSCETACEADATCKFFALVNGTSCELHDSTCEIAPSPGTNTYVSWLENAPPCYVDVSNHPQAMHDGRYVKATPYGAGEEYRKADNSSRIKWKALGDSTCDGWVLQENSAAIQSVALYNCSDDNAAAGAYTGSLSSTPCAAGNALGNCTNVVFAGLCPATCIATETDTFADQEHAFQNPELGVNSSCLGDNSIAAHQYADDAGLNWNTVGAGRFCEEFANATMCTVDLAIRKLCWSSCESILHPHHRRLLTVTWLDAATGTWDNKFRTWANGSEIESEYNRTNCDTSGTQAGAANVTYLTRTFMWHVEVPADADSAMQAVCRSESQCPMYTTCHMAPLRFDDEMSLFRPAMTWPARFRDIADDNDRYAKLSGSNYVPKVIISALRAEAIVDTEHWEFGKEIFRSVPGHTRVRLAQWPSETTHVIASLSSSEDHYAQTNFGRTYAVPAGYEDWVSDVLRVEAFENVTIVNQTTFEFDIYVPVVGSPFGLKVFRFDDDVAAPPVLETNVVKSASSDNWWRVRTTNPNADFVATVDRNECEGDNQCESDADGGVCVNEDASYSCACKAGYTGDGWTTGEQCTLTESWDFHTSYADYSKQTFLLYHQTKLDNGWRLKHVKMYYDEQCTVAGPTLETIEASGTYPTSSPEFVRDGVNAEWWCDTLSADRDRQTGCWLKFSYTITDGPDGSPRDVKCIRVEQADCEGHYAPEISIRRTKVGHEGEREGWRGQPDGFAVRGHPGWTQLWNFERKQQADTYQVTCGEKDVQIFGELLNQDGYTGVASPCVCKQLCMDHVDEGCRSWKYYEETQHCYLQRNVFQGNDMATSTKRKRGTKIKGQGWWKDPSDSWKGWVSGSLDPMPMKLRTEPAVVTADTEFTVHVEGAGFPYDPERWEDTSARQRIKVVEEDAHCSVAPLPEHVKGLSCSTPQICSPKPVSADRERVSFGGVSIGVAKKDSRYKVCYCPGKCTLRSSWIEVPGLVQLSAAKYAWKLETENSDATNDDEPTVTTKDTVKLRLSRPSFSSTAASTAWRVKLVRDLFTCKHRGEETICGGADDCGAPSTSTPPHGPDEALWTSIALMATTPAGKYHVCFSEDAGTTWSATPSAETFFLNIETHPDHSTAPTGPFKDQVVSVKAGSLRYVSLAGHKFWTPTQSKIALVQHADGCQAPQATIDAALVVAADASRSTADALVFGVQTAADASGKFSICYCDEQTGTTAAGTGTFYGVTEDQKCSDANGYLSAAGLGDYQSDVCYTKCNAGCVGADCFCDGYDSVADTAATDASLCLSPTKCRDACTATAGCVGYVMANDKNRCMLIGDMTTCAAAADVAFDLWTKTATTDVCALTDYRAADATEAAQKTLGTVWVTQKADVGVDYVVAPKEEASLELTGTNMSYFRDRVMVIDCQGTCGVSEPADAAGRSTAEWSKLDAVNAFFDKPHNDTEGPFQPTASLPRVYSYIPKREQYCPGNNIRIRDHESRLVRSHQCFRKCWEEAPCQDQFCFCDGFLQSRDTEESDALCLDEVQCKRLCNSLDNCFGIDMHRSKSRCFLNLADTCADMVNMVGGSTLAPDDDYDFMLRTEDNNLQGRRLAAAVGSTGRQLLSALDPGISWGSMLRFKPVQFSSGGTFKLCYCDSDLLAAGHVCNQPKDFTIEIGTVHSSGIHCLLSNPKLQAGKCVPQFFGGMRCYADAESVPATPFPDEYLGVPDPAAAPRSDSELLRQMSAWCVFGPPEETMNNPMCAMRA